MPAVTCGTDTRFFWLSSTISLARATRSSAFFSRAPMIRYYTEIKKESVRKCYDAAQEMEISRYKNYSILYSPVDISL